MNIQFSDALPPNTILAAPPWINEVRIVAGVAVRLRGTAIKDGKAYQQFSALTDDELKQFALLKNVGTDTSHNI